MLDNGIVQTRSGEMAARCALLARAFDDDPPTRWVFPDAITRGELFCRFATAFAGEASGAGTVDVVDDAGVAFWLPPGFHPDEAALESLFRSSVPPERLDAVFALFDQMAACHPDVPHWHLALIGVEPARRGQGLGSRLLEMRLRQLDAARQTAYLEATSPRNVALYRRFGFELAGRIQVGDSPEIIPMMRDPR